MVGFWIRWGLGLGLWTLSMLLASPYDLPLSRAVTDEKSGFSWFVSTFGEIPGWILIAASVGVLLGGCRERSRVVSFRPLGWAVLVHALVLPLAITQALKLLWGRVRFIHLAPDWVNYTPFYLPAGLGAGLSFPSGHVAMAVVGATIPFFLWQRRSKRAALAALAVVAGWGMVVSAGRIAAGKHYLTDCLFSFGAAWLLAPLLVCWLDRGIPAATVGQGSRPRVVRRAR